MAIDDKTKSSVIIQWIIIGLFCGASPAFSQIRELPLFQQHPEKRAELSERIGQRQHAEQTNAIAWAQARGIKVREESGGRVRELMAVRNGQPIYYVTDNANAAISTAASSVRQTLPYNVSGEGIKVGIWDAGSVLSTHQEFGGRVTVKDGATSNYHATHIGGTIAATGIVAAAKGMAPSVSVDSYDWTSDISELTSAGAAGSGQTNKVYLSNHSYSYSVTNSSFYYLFGLYTSDVRDMDNAMSGLQYCLPFAAAGNERNDAVYKNGYDTISYLGIAKNVMTVGAVYDAVSGGVRSLSKATMTSFSSWGPTDDGRIKPDIVANGYGLYSTYNTSNSSYATMSGTSMATPNACGSATLLVEYYKNLTSGGAMLASTLKGLIIHTADDLGNVGPDYSYGWGLMNTLSAAALIKDYSEGNTNRITESTLTTSVMSRSYTFPCSGVSSLRVTLCWTDQAGLSDGSSNDNRSADLVNDLDLKVTAPNGTVFYPYKLDYSNPTNLATTDSENSVDNVEQVYISNPLPGNYTVTVDCDEALRYYDSTRSQLRIGGTQNYSLLVSGTYTDLDGDGLPNDWELLYFGGETNAIASADPDGDGSDNLTEYIAGTDPTSPDSVFKITSFSMQESNGTPFVITWDSVEGRIYNVGWSGDLISPAFTSNYSADLPYPANSYTDTVERAGEKNFYRVDVRLDK